MKENGNQEGTSEQSEGDNSCVKRGKNPEPEGGLFLTVWLWSL
jgi:hypothetical protein